jgi:Zn finger protein HypA/HybF involved in hydrogenase expression
MQIDEMIKLLDKEEKSLLEEMGEKEIRFKEINITKNELIRFKQQLKLKCDKCNGTGKVFHRSCAEDDGDYYNCDKCNGIGIIRP